MASKVVQNLITEGYIKTISDKIIQGIEKVENAPDYELRRWIWELMQNAKDVDNAFDGVSIEIELSQELLIFRHNADPFEIQHLTSLIQQVSSKDDSDIEATTTGKFGTGFMTTHMLSRLIHVKGIVQSEIKKYQRFELAIDRRASTSEEMKQLLGNALSHILELDNYEIFPLQENYQSTRKKTDFDTIFEYPLDERGLNTARTGIADLETALPYTMIFVPKLQSMRIIDHTTDSDIRFTRGRPDPFDNITVYPFLREDERTGTIENIYVAAISDGKITLARRLDSNPEISIRESGAGLPKIFKDFPLVGTGNFHLPVVLNSHIFMPTEARDGIYLKNTRNENVKHNKSLLQGSLTLIETFIQSAINQGFKNLHYLALSSLPENTKDYIDLDWYQKAIQLPLRRFLLKQALVETENGLICLRDAIFPVFKENKETSTELFDICHELKWELIPKKQYHLEWLEIIHPQYDKWGVNLKYTIENLLEDVARIGNMDSLQEKLKNQSATEWLNRIISFLITEEIKNHLDRYAVIPNQNGIFKKLPDLKYDDNIPEELKEVQKILGEDWKNQLINREIFRIEKHPDLSVNDISSAINKSIASLSTSGTNTKESGLFKLVSILTSNQSETRNKIFNYAKTILKDKIADLPSIVPGTSDFNWEPINKWAITKILKEIEQQSNTGNLATYIEKTEYDTLFFLNEMLGFLHSKDDFKEFLDKYRTIPCQYGDFRYLSELSNDKDNTPDDLKEILFALDRGQDWKIDLLHSSIEINTTRQKTISELCNKIDELVREKNKNDELSDTNVKRMVLRLLSRFKDTALDYEGSFKWLFNNRAQVQVQLMDEYQGVINRILENESILPHLAIIAESGIAPSKLENLLKIMENNTLQPEQLTNILSAVEEFGTDDVLKIVNQKLEEKRDFEFKERIGTYAETAFREAVTHLGLNLSSHRKPLGQDYTITKPGTSKEYHIEIKSISTNTDSVLVSSTQGKTAVSNQEAYALCVIRRNSIYTSMQDFIENAKFVPNIGSLLRDKVRVVGDFEQHLFSKGDEIEINFENPTYKFKVYEQVWVNGFDFHPFFQWLNSDFFGS